MRKTATWVAVGILAATTAYADPYKGKSLPPKERIQQAITECIGRGWNYIGFAPESGGNHYTVFYGDPNNNNNVKEVKLTRLDNELWVLGSCLVPK